MTTDTPNLPAAALYRQLAGTLRGLVPAMQYPDTRGDLNWLAADYERLARFAEARRQAAQAQRRRATLAISATARAQMEKLFDEFAKTVAHTLRIRADFIRTELDLGLTFVDGALKARGPRSQQQCIKNAIATLNTANRFLALEPRIIDSDIDERRNELRQRLHEVLDEHRSLGLSPKMQ
jgi:signal transduction histidine kinase